MTRLFLLLPVLTALLCGAVPRASGLEVDASFSLDNIGFTPTRAVTDKSLPGAAFFWGGSLSVQENLSDSIQIDAALASDQLAGNSISALFQYKTANFRVGMGPFLGLFNSSSSVLKSGISTLVGLELPGRAFVTLRTDDSLGGQSSIDGGYSVEVDDLAVGFYAGVGALCTLGLTYTQLDRTAGAVQVVDSLTNYSLEVKTFEKNVPFRLDFTVAYQVLLRQDGAGNPSPGLGSLIAGAGIDLLLSSNLALTLDFRGSVWSGGSGSLAGQSDVGFAPLLFRATAGFALTLPDTAAAAATP
jgi:hypothetical protein